MIHLRSNRDFRYYFFASRPKTKKMYLVQRGNTCWFLFHLLTACCYNSNAAHTLLHVEKCLHNSCRCTILLPWHPIWNNVFHMNGQFLNYCYPRFDDDGCFFSFFSLPTQSLSFSDSSSPSEAGNAVHLGLICETLNRIDGLGHCLMQAVNYPVSNEIKRCTP